MNATLDRRTFLKAACAAAVATQAEGAFAQAPRKPNIIYIMADDLGYGDLTCYGQEKIQTPNIGMLAVQSTRFTQCYTGSPVCAPSRSVLMTGQHAGHTRVRGNSGVNEPKHDGQKGRIPLEPEDVTIARVLKDAGYATGIAGKWGLGEPGSTGLPNDHGFDEWYGYLNQDHAPDYFTDYLWRNTERMPIPANKAGAEAVYSCDLFTNFALDFIRTNKDKPFFLYLPYTIPHAELEVPDLGPYADEEWDEEAKILAAMISRLDRDVGRILAELDSLNLAQDTIVFFCSDNGASRPQLEFFRRSGDLRALKGSLYEGGIRTPMIVRWPGRIPADTVSDAVWYFADFLPTAAAIAGASPPPGIDGVNVLPSLRGEDQPALRGRFLYWEHHSNNAMGQAVRWDDWKAVRPGPQAPIQLYNLANDPAEANDVAEAQPEVVARIETYLATARVDSPHWPFDPERSLNL